MTREKYQKPLKMLRQERDVLNVLISKLEKEYPRAIDVAYERLGENHRFEVLGFEGDPQGDQAWRQLERVFCKKVCDKCPHGDYWYEYSRGSNGSVMISFSGENTFDYVALKQMEKEALPYQTVEFDEEKNA